MTSTVHGVFEQWAARTPDAVAVVCDDGQLTYAELDAWADAVAGDLAGSGVVVGDRVGVCVRRSPALIASLLGILKAGAGYVPVDADDPAPRVGTVLNDADVSLVLVDAHTAPAISAHPVPVALVDRAGARRGANDRPGTGTAPLASTAIGDPVRVGPVRVGGSDVAYLMYTSGSTGAPKAVVVEHHSIVNLVVEPTFVDLGPDDRLPHLAPVAFDASTFEIWGALLNGARLVLAPPGPMLSETLETMICDFDVTVLWLTAALFHRQIDERPQAFRRLRTVIAGGDVLSASHVRRLMDAAPECQVVNGYGPTEATTFTCTHRVAPADVTPADVTPADVTPADVTAGSIPIGRPIQNVSVHILDPAGSPVPPGATGELCIGEPASPAATGAGPSSPPNASSATRPWPAARSSTTAATWPVGAATGWSSLSGGWTDRSRSVATGSSRARSRTPSWLIRRSGGRLSR